MSQPHRERSPNDGAPPPEEDGDHHRSSLPSPPMQSRRRALGLLVSAGTAAYAGALVIPAGRFLAAGAASEAGGRWLRVIRLDALADGVPTRVSVRGDRRDAFTVTKDVNLGSVWLRRDGSDVTALSSECPHLGCAIDLRPDGKTFGCPCHASRFALDGANESGPSPRGMDPLQARVNDGWVEVELRRFRQGIAERVEVGA